MMSCPIAVSWALTASRLVSRTVSPARSISRSDVLRIAGGLARLSAPVSSTVPPGTRLCAQAGMPVQARLGDVVVPHHVPR